MASYGWALSRIDAVDGRLQTLQAFSATFTVAAPVLARALGTDISFRSGWFVAAVAVFVLVVVLGALARAIGGIKILAPGVLFEEWVELEEREFKREAIFWAGEHYAANMKVVELKGWAANAMTALFLVEILLLAAWIAA